MPQPRVNQVHVDATISNAAIRYSNTSYIADEVAPKVPVVKDTGKYFEFDRGDFLRDDALDARAPGTRAPRSGYNISTGDYTLLQIAHASTVPDEILDNADDVLRPFEDAANFSMEMIHIRKERRASDALFASSVWNTDKTVDNQWSDFANSDPADDIATGLTAVLKETGFLPNVLVIGREVLDKLVIHPDGLDRFKHTQTGILDVGDVARWLGVDRIVVGNAVYNTAVEGQTQSNSFIWGKNALLMFVPAGPSISTPSAAYTFEREDIQTLRFREEAEHQDVVEVTVRSEIKVTAATAGYYFPSVVA
tara:strand:+ start:499 stop:1422 length:924 start_codon:yes stop_codon:yes gene_type:complete